MLLPQAAVFTRAGEDRLLLPEGAAVAEKLRLDVGWTLHKKADDAEDTAVEFSIQCFNLAVRSPVCPVCVLHGSGGE